MAGPKSPRVIELTEEERATLVHWTRSPSAAAGLLRRAPSVLLAAQQVPARRIALQAPASRTMVREWLDRFRQQRLPGLQERPRPGRPRAFPPEVELHLGRVACELPEQRGRSLSQWECAELARQLQRDGLLERISPQTVQRWLTRRRLKPWRSHLWLHPHGPRDAEFVRCTRAGADLLTRPLLPSEVVLSVDEKTSLQPRPRRAPTRPACPERPIQVEHEYARRGALQLFAAFNTRRGRACRRKRQLEYLAFLEDLDRDIPPAITTSHLLGDNVSVQHGRQVRSWLGRHPRFVAHFTPVHCSWMNPVEQWFGILQRKRLRHPAFADLADLAAKITQFIAQWNEVAHPFRWTAASFEKILAKLEALLPTDASLPEAA